MYGDYDGGGWKWGKADYAANALVIYSFPAPNSLLRITDGTSNTILAGEKAMNPADYASGTWHWDEPFFLGNCRGLSRDGTQLLRDPVAYTFPNNWGSPHPSGVQFAFCDGSVRLLAFQTPPQQVRALLTPNGGEVVPGF